MLGTGVLAEAALDALGGAGGFLDDVAVAELSGPAVEPLLAVQTAKQLGDLNALGADLGAVAAIGAGDQVLRFEVIPDLGDGLMLLGGQGLEGLHVAAVFHHHFQIAHAGENHHDAFKAGGKADGVAGIAAALELIQDGLGLLGQVHQRAATDGLHNDDGFAVLAADFPACPGLDGFIIKVQIVELELHHFHQGALCQDLIQNIGGVMEGHAQMTDPAGFLQCQNGLVSLAVLVLLEIVAAQGMHQVEIKVFHAAGCQLLLKNGQDVRLGLEEVAGELVGKYIAFSGITAGQAVAQGELALAVEIAMGGVKIVETGLHEGVYHPGGQLQIHILADHGQTHKAKTEILLDVFHKMLLIDFFLVKTYNKYYTA